MGMVMRRAWKGIVTRAMSDFTTVGETFNDMCDVCRALRSMFGEMSSEPHVLRVCSLPM